MRTPCLCVFAIALLAAGGTALGGGDKDDLKKIQGTWKFVSQEMDGKATPAEKLAKMTSTFKGDKWTVREDDTVLQAGTHKFDSSKKPGHIDAVVTEGEGKGNKMLGIYELKGDKMKVCFDLQGKE